MAERFGATPFDIDDAFWSHRGETCTFDTMLEEFALRSEPLLRLALTPQSAGLRAAFPGWNAAQAAPLVLPDPARWQQHCIAWRDTLLAQPDLTSQLLGFVAEKR